MHVCTYIATGVLLPMKCLRPRVASSSWVRHSSEESAVDSKGTASSNCCIMQGLPPKPPSPPPSLPSSLPLLPPPPPSSQ